MEAVQRYVISMTEEEAESLYDQIGQLPSGKVSDELLELYQTLKIWLS